MGDGIKSEVSKLAKANQHGIPWAAVLVAALGMWEARQAANKSADAVEQAEVSKKDSAQSSEVRLRHAYEGIQKTMDAHTASIALYEQRTSDLETWVVELEGWVEEMVDEDSPRNYREREAREERLAEIRTKKAKRERAKASFHSAKPPSAAGKLPDYDAVQRTAPPDPLLE